MSDATICPRCGYDKETADSLCADCTEELRDEQPPEPVFDGDGRLAFYL